MNIFKTKKKKSHIPIITATAIFLASSAFWIADQAKAVVLPQAENPIEIYSNQTNDDLRGTLVAGIEEAKKSIVLIIYSLTDQDIIQALKKKSEEGVEVTVICDPKASPYTPKKLGKNILVKKRYNNALMHQKILVVDGVKTWIGSANMTHDSLRVHGNLILGFYCPELADCVLRRADSILKGVELPPQDIKEYNIAGQKTELWFLPENQDAVPAIKDLIRSAKKTVRVAMFTWTRYDLANEIIAAQKKGVDTHVVIDYNSGKGASSKVVKLLKDNGIPVYLSQSTGLLHHKFLYIDGETLVNGSANWTLAAFTKNDDCFIILHKLTDQQRQHLDSLWEAISDESVAP